MRKLTLRHTMLVVTEALFLASCTSAPPTIVHETVGPSLADLSKTDDGFLVVYSATAGTTLDGDGTPQLNHTDYKIDGSDGHLFESVNNSEQDEPSRITLPKGNYTVVAQSDSSGTVSVPVRIEPGQITVLHLEREEKWNAPAGADLVRLPNGQPIGCRAPHAESIKGAIAQSKYTRPALAQ